MSSASGTPHRLDSRGGVWRKARGPAWLCALTVMALLALGHPFAEAGICDDFSYVYTAKHLAETGHLVYVGWAAAMLGWQVYFAAGLFHLLGFSFTAARLTGWFSAAACAFLLQRVLVRSGVAERNAVIASLCFTLSPVFFMLSTTFMTDVEGILAVLVCLYGCIRCLQADTEQTAAAWIAVAAISNAALGTCRQVSWLGALVMVPATLFLVRSRRRVFAAGSTAVIVAGCFMLLSVHWFHQQPWTMTSSVAAGAALQSRAALLAHVFRELVAGGLELPFLLLPLTAVFLPQLFRMGGKTKILLFAIAALYAVLAFHWRHAHPEYLLEPTTGNWLGVYGYTEASGPRGHGPALLPLTLRALLTLLSLGGVCGIIALLTRQPPQPRPAGPGASLSWKQLLFLLVPFSVIYAAVLVPFAVSELFDRYLLALVLLPAIALPRLYQERVSERLSSLAVLLLAGIAAYSVSCVHNTFAQQRAEIAIDQQLGASGLNANEVDFGWAYDGWNELQSFGHINNPAIRFPANVFVPVAPTVDPACYQPPVLFRYLQPRYGVSYDLDLCSGGAPVPPVTYRTWPTGKLATLYVVKYTPLQGRW